MNTKIYGRSINKAFIVFVIFYGLNSSALGSIYTNDMDYVLGDVKQAFIQDKISTEEQVDNLLTGFKAMAVNGIRIPIFAEGLEPNKAMFDYFYSQAVAQGFLIFANPAQSSGGQRIANGILDGTIMSVKDDTTATNKLINRVKNFAQEYKCTWINPFNEDGAPDAAWSTNQMNTIYSSLFNNLNGAVLIGPCVWGIPASIKVLNNTNISNYITVASTHNLGFNHSSWSTFISAAEEKNLPVWDSEVNHYDKYGTGTRLEAALENKVDGLVLYNSWNTISLTDGSINDNAEEWMSLYLKSIATGIQSVSNEINNSIRLYPNPVNTALTITNGEGAKLEIYNNLGKLVFQNNSLFNVQLVDMSSFTNGIYLLKINLNEVVSSHKIIKK